MLLDLPSKFDGIRAVNRWKNVDDPHNPTGLAPELPRPREGAKVSVRRIQRTQDPSEAKILSGCHLLHVHARPNWTFRIVKHFCCHGAEQKSPEWSMTVCRQNDQADLLRL